MTFKERDPVSSKIITGNKIIEQVKSFHYLGNFISYDQKMDIDKKLCNCLKITGIINSVYIYSPTHAHFLNDTIKL